MPLLPNLPTLKAGKLPVSLQPIMGKVSLPQGTRDFNAGVVYRRNYIFQTIRDIFELFGFEPLETPAMENLETLMGKYGDEGDKLIFRILNNGLDRPEKHGKARADFETVLDGRNATGITERALRYDLTIPFARYVAMNHGKLSFPYKRYQMQPVWRADRPQKGRYREFYQCDADVVGSNSLINELELATIYKMVFQKLKVPVEIRINNRLILAGLAEACGGAEQMTSITVAIDKLDKIGLEKVKEELEQKGLTSEQIGLIEQYLKIEGSTTEKLASLENLLGHIDSVKEGIQALRYLLENSPANTPLVPDFTLARGLNYYTGVIFEVKALNVQMGSIGGGGRYDNLTGLFGVPNIAGVGISFGVDRIYDVMEELGLFPETFEKSTRILFFNMGEKEAASALKAMNLLREAGIPCELFHENQKMDKQFKYADKKGISFAGIIGSAELASGTCVVKNLKTGTQETMVIEALPDYLSKTI